MFRQSIPNKEIAYASVNMMAKYAGPLLLVHFVKLQVSGTVSIGTTFNTLQSTT